MNLTAWAIKWGVSIDAINEMRRELGIVYQPPIETDGMSEAAVSSRVMLEASEKGIWLLRNNVGGGKLVKGGFVRWGLANESKAQNKIIKSSDLIGIRPLLITRSMVGSIIGQFVARETKPENWHYKATEHEIAQLAFINKAVSLGADAKFTNKVGSL